MISRFVELLIKTPFYPHWLDFRNKNRANDELLKYFKGKVLETGAGNCEKKERILARNRKIESYIATDYTSWDEEFAKQKRSADKLGIITRLLYGATKEKGKIDRVCDALDLPFKKGRFDTYASFEVVEHIEDPLKLLKEANRVLKRGGNCIITSPFLYREHGGIEMDFRRLTKGGFHKLASDTGFKIVKILTYSHFGTTVAILINQFVIRKIIEGSIATKILLLPLAPFIFFLANSIGYLFDLVDKDERFAARYHVVMEKS